MLTRTAALAACLCACSVSAQPETARYTLTFDATWSGQTHPNAYPASAHFSPLIGATHSDRAVFWAPEGIATPGIEQMAETGGTSILRNEINAAISASDALAIVSGAGIDSPDSLGGVEFEATRDADRLTLVTMIAPSPDWFIGTHGLALRDQNGDWIASLTVELPAYDAGTDSGPAFFSPNADVTPHDPITDFSATPPFAGTPSLGTFTITLLEVTPCPADINRDGEADGSDFFAWVAAFGNQDPAADVNGDGSVTGSDFFSWVAAFGIGCE